MVFLLSVSRSFEVRGPLGYLYDVGAFALPPTSALLVSVLFRLDSANIDGSPWSSGLSLYGLGSSRSAVSISVLQLGWLYFPSKLYLVGFFFYLLTYIRHHELIHTVATSRGHDRLNSRQSWSVDYIKLACDLSARCIVGAASGYIKAVQRTTTGRISHLSSRAVGELLTDLYTSNRVPRSDTITTISRLRIESGLFWRSHSIGTSPVSSDGLVCRCRVRSFFWRTVSVL